MNAFIADLNIMAAHFAALRSRIELDLAGRVAAPFAYRDRKTVETVSSGMNEIDCLTGGLPRGSLTEIYGLAGSGRMSVLISALAARTGESETCALVDGRDAFDPCSAEAAGVKLDRLLWVRCKNLDQSLRAADLLLQGGGFGLIAIDLSDIAPETVRRVPLNSWFRFRRGVEDTRGILLVLEQESNAKTCASLVLKFARERTHWSMASTAAETNDFLFHPCARLLHESESRTEVVRSRIEPASDYFRELLASTDGSTAIMKTKSIRNVTGGIPLVPRVKAKTR